MKTCGNCKETYNGIEHQPFCNADGQGTTDVSGDTSSFAKDCFYYNQCNCSSCETIRGR